MNYESAPLAGKELAFVKLYTTTLEREYDMFLSALTLMSARGLRISCPFQAAIAAHEMQQLHADFDAELAQLATKHQFPHKKDAVAHPTVEELTRIIQMSFFKLLKPAQPPAPPDDKGWFSGHPLDWEKAWVKTQKAELPAEVENVMTALFAAMAKLFKKAGFGDNLVFPPVENTNWHEQEFDYGADDEEEEKEDDEFDTPY